MTKVLWELHLSTVQSSRPGNSSPNLSLSATQTGILRKAVFPILDTRTSQCWAEMKWRCSAGVTDSFERPGEKRPWHSTHPSFRHFSLPTLWFCMARSHVEKEHVNIRKAVEYLPFICKSVSNTFQSWSSFPMSSGSVAHGSQLFQASLGVLQAEGALQHLGSRHFLTGFVLSCEMCNNPWPDSVTVFFSKC